MDPTFADMEAKRKAMVESFGEVAKAMNRCVEVVNDFVKHAPAIGMNLPTMAKPFKGMPSGDSGKAAKKAAAAAENPAAAAAAVPAFSVAGGSEVPAVAGAKRGRKPNKDKKIKDPNAPKRPPSAYLLYQNEIRDQIRQSLPADTPYKEVLMAIAKAWKELPADEKLDYQKIYDAANADFKGKEQDYKNDAFATATTASALAAAAAAAEVAAESEEESESADSDESSDAPAAPVKSAPAPVLPKGSLGAAVAGGEKKNKKGQDGSNDGPEKKKKRKSKGIEA